MTQKYRKIEREIAAIKKKLIAKVKRYGLYENFGQREVRMLEDKYSDYRYGTYEERNLYKLIEDFNEWCMDY